MPAPRRAEFEAVVAKHLGLSLDDGAPLPLAAIEAAATIDPRRPNMLYEPVGQRIVEGLLVGAAGDTEEEDARLTEFIRGWRRHFLEEGLGGRREFLPPYWSVDFRVKSRLRIKPEERRAFEVTN